MVFEPISIWTELQLTTKRSHVISSFIFFFHYSSRYYSLFSWIYFYLQIICWHLMLIHESLSKETLQLGYDHQAIRVLVTNGLSVIQHVNESSVRLGHCEMAIAWLSFTSCPRLFTFIPHVSLFQPIVVSSRVVSKLFDMQSTSDLKDIYRLWPNACIIIS